MYCVVCSSWRHLVITNVSIVSLLAHRRVRRIKGDSRLMQMFHKTNAHDQMTKVCQYYQLPNFLRSCSLEL